MGNCGSSEERGENDKQITDLIKKERKEMEKTVKILVLGAGESGKSTLVKQMKIIHGDGYSKDELKDFRVSILENIRDSVSNITNAMTSLSIEYENADNAKLAEHFSDQDVSTIVEIEDFSQEMADAAKSIWADAGVQKAYQRRNEFHLVDSCKYFLDSLDRIYQDDYEPSQDDALRVRVRTTGILETRFYLEDLIYKMIDVGGQRSERRKWIQCFEDVTAIIFVAALSGYDMMLFEDANQNRLSESVEVFKSTFQTVQVFAKTNCILFLNKQDLFEKKMATSSLKKYHPEYTGEDGDVQAGGDYIYSLYEKAFKNPDEPDGESSRTLYRHFTTATDTGNIEVVFNVVNDLIVQINLHQCGLI
jgi:GTPase SAR1 family protein